MTYLCLFVGISLSYTATLLLQTRGALIFVMLFAMFHSAVFCGFYGLVRNLIARSPHWAFLYANVVMLGLWLAFRLILAKTGNFSERYGSHHTWISGVPTPLGWYLLGQTAVFCIVNHSIGYGMCRLGQTLLPASVRQTMNR